MNQTRPILLNLVAALLGAGGQYLYKVGAQRLRAVPLHHNWQIGAGMALFIGVMVLFIASFRLGGRLSVTYPMYATTFIWGTLLGIAVDKEPWSMTLLGGIALVVCGLTCIAAGARA